MVDDRRTQRRCVATVAVTILMRAALATLAAATTGVTIAMLGGQALLSRLANAAWFVAMPAAMQALSANLLIFGPLLAIAVIGSRLARSSLTLGGPARGRAVLLGLALGAAGLLLATAEAWVAGTIVPGAGGAQAALLVGLAAIVVQAGVEEVYFRGWLQPLLVSAWGAVPALLVTALAFSLLHVLGGARAPLALLNLFLGGLWFGLMAWRSGGLALPMAAHIAWNATEQLGLGLDPNPGIGSFGAVMDLDLIGPVLWGGSTQGLNGSIGTMAVLLALILPLAFWSPSISRPVPRG